MITTDLQVSISDARDADSGWYFCVAENSGGKSIKSFYLQVYGKLIRLKTFKFIKAVSDTAFDMMIKAIYHNKPWIFIGATLQEKVISYQNQ